MKMLCVLVYWNCMDVLFLRKASEDTDSKTTDFLKSSFYKMFPSFNITCHRRAEVLRWKTENHLHFTTQWGKKFTVNPVNLEGIKQE